MDKFEDFKKPYEDILKANKINIKDYDLQEVVKNLHDGIGDKDIQMSILVIASWKSFKSVYWKQKTRELNMQDCYDIFLDSIYYLIDRQPWLDESNSMHGDKDAFLKGMNTRIKSFKLNWIEAQHKQKRRANYKTASLSYIDDTFTEGLVDDDEEREDDELNEIPLDILINDVIKEYWEHLQYEEAIMCHILLTGDIYDADNRNGINFRKLRAELRDYYSSEEFADVLAVTYEIKQEVAREGVKRFATTIENNSSAKKLDEIIYLLLKQLRLNMKLKKYLTE